MTEFPIGEMAAAIVAGNLISAAFLAAFSRILRGETPSGLVYAGLLMPLAVVVLGFIAAG